MASTVQVCTKLVETTILAFASSPDTTERSELTITLTLEGDAAAGIPSKRILGIKSNVDVAATFGNVFGTAHTVSSKSFRAAALGIHLRGLISFTGHPTKAHQYVFVNGHRITRTGICGVIREAYKSANVLAEEMDEEEAEQRRTGNRGSTRLHSLHPVFLLHLKLPREDLDHGLEPLKHSVLFKVRPISFA